MGNISKLFEKSMVGNFFKKSSTIIGCKHILTIDQVIFEAIGQKFMLLAACSDYDAARKGPPPRY